jgi:NTE family protein
VRAKACVSNNRSEQEKAAASNLVQRRPLTHVPSGRTRDPARTELVRASRRSALMAQDHSAVPLRILVLGGGNALGSYLAGAYEALREAGEEPDWIVGSSIGALTAALIAGNPSERRLERLRAFWDRATAPDWLPWPLAAQWTAAVQTRLLGRPALFHVRVPSIGGRPERLGIYDPDPMRRQLESLIDFDRLNHADTRVSVLAVDLETGAEIVFDNGRTRLTIDHLMASAALIPDFPPVRIGDRWLVDGGLAANVPLDLVLIDTADRNLVCFVVDPFPLGAPAPRDLAGMSMRQTDLTFALQTERTLRTMLAIDRCGPAERPRIDVVRTSYRADEDETMMKTWDFSATALRRRWNTGRLDMEEAIRQFRLSRVAGAGLIVHAVPPRATGRA